MGSFVSQSQGHDAANVHIWAVHMHVQLELLTNSLDVLQALLEIRSSAADPDGDLVLDQRRRKFSQGTNDAFECRGDLE